MGFFKVLLGVLGGPVVSKVIQEDSGEMLGGLLGLWYSKGTYGVKDESKGVHRGLMVLKVVQWHSGGI